jgi:drug/metabolite transporter (DMT)-like permease
VYGVSIDINQSVVAVLAPESPCKAANGPECQNGFMQSTSTKPESIQSMNLQRQVKSSAIGGLLLLIAAMSCFAVLDTTTKYVTASVPLLMALWVLFLVQTLAAGGYVLLARDWASLKTTRMGLHLTRGALMLTVQMLAFFSLHYLPVGEFTAMAMTTPLLVTLLASRFLGEHVSFFRLALVACGLAGTLVIVRPGSNAMGWAMLLPLALVLVNSAFQLLASKMARTEDAVTTLFYTCLTALVLTSLPLAWVWVPIDSVSLWMGLLLMGIAAAAGNLLFILAFERAPAATLMPYMYLQIGFGILGGWLMYDHIPDFWALVGMGLVAACGVAGGLLTLYEMRVRSSDLIAGLKHEPARSPTLAQPILTPIKQKNN